MEFDSLFPQNLKDLVNSFYGLLGLYSVVIYDFENKQYNKENNLSAVVRSECYKKNDAANMYKLFVDFEVINYNKTFKECISFYQAHILEKYYRFCVYKLEDFVRYYVNDKITDYDINKLSIITIGLISPLEDWSSRDVLLTLDNNHLFKFVWGLTSEYIDQGSIKF